MAYGETFFGLARRRRQAEWMDAPDVDPALLDDSLRFIRKVNARLRYTRATLSHLEKFSTSWKRGAEIRILDVATGSADVPLAMARWGEVCGFDLQIVGVDLHEKTCEAARRATRNEKCVRIMRCNALRLPFDAGSFDYCVCSMFLHHLSDEDARSVLVEMDRVARRGLIAADLLRSRRAYFWINLFTMLANPMVRHDARVSIAQAFNHAEILALRQRSGLNYLRWFRHPAHRFVLAGEK